MTGQDRKLRIALIGHCLPDSYALRSAIGRVIAGAEFVSANDEAALRTESERSDLLLVNRALDGDFPDKDGVDMIRRLIAAGKAPALMLISNYPESQAQAVAAGALPGFGKKEMNTPRAAELLRNAAGGRVG